ncbi:hypothetical protein GCK72_012054 [Caenorhabditis remanei]|uniref:Uncharacterized protein n=1 Tax=Caenorhabditis remanei TaxID=31234 RepID=A0A6A5GLP9_CAERE|nr:hypothetical protein GCK72_012054 [Caenorhabditis remanei]KAF1755604.1 hypothetical protein GCK72_012054 [Caenorhabditis remanei]
MKIKLTEDGVVWVHGDLILGGISNQTLGVGESDVRWSGSVSLVVGNDLDLSVLEDSNAGVGGSEIDSNCVVLAHFTERK